jgi:glycosyltransferase involved in cell wall biosynthesis
MTGTSRPYPRLLIVGYDIVAGTGGGVTLSCLLDGWPRNRIAIAAGNRDLGVSGFAGHYYRLGALEDRWIWPFSSVPRESWKVSGPVCPGSSGQRSCAPHGNPSREESPARGASLRRLLYAALDLAGAQDELHGLRLSPPFLEWVNAYQPEIIYTLLGSLSLVRFVRDLSATLRIPAALHFMDDWPSVIYRHGLMAPMLRRKLNRELRLLVNGASAAMAISDPMSAEYSRRYGRTFLTFHNALDPDDWLATSRTSWETGSPIEILYAGRIGIANESSITDVASSVELLADGGLDIRLSVLTSDVACPVADTLREMRCVDLIPAVPHPAVPARLAAADILILPLDFGDAEQRFARYSMPTKTVEYMASGTPVVVYAPEDHAVSRYAASGEWGLVVGSRDTSALADTFLSLVKNISLREELGRRAMGLALANHDAGTIRDRFRETLISAAYPTGFPLKDAEP